MIAFLSRHFLDNIYGNLWIFQVEPVLNNKDIMINKYCYFTWSKTIEHFGQTLSVFSFLGRSFSSVGVKQLDPRFKLTGPSIQLFASGLSLPQRSSAELTDSVFKLSTSSGELLDPFWAARMSRCKESRLSKLPSRDSPLVAFVDDNRELVRENMSRLERRENFHRLTYKYLPNSQL